MIIRPVKFIENENENKNATGEDTYAGALRAPRAGSPDCVIVFVSVFVYVKFVCDCLQPFFVLSYP